jgi:HEAT repeat protein
MSSGKFFTVIAVLLAVGVSGVVHPLRADAKGVDPDENLLREANIGTDNASLLALLGRQSENDGELPHLDRLIQRLGSPDFQEREDATARLVAMGLVTLPSLRKAVNDQDPERARRAEDCVSKLEQDDSWTFALPAVRLLVRRKAPGTVEALVRYLPFVVDDETEEGIWYGVSELVEAAGKAPPVLVRSLTDPLAGRRAVAACLVGRWGGEEERRQVQKLLHDADSTVRLRAAQGLLAGKGKEGIPTLIDLLQEPAIQVAWQAEELLHWVGGERAPKAVVGAGEKAARQKCKAAWEKWWQEQDQTWTPEKALESHCRPILLWVWESTDMWDQTGNLVLCGCDGQPRWTLTGLPRLGTVQLLAEGSVLLAERGNDRITERTLDGTVKWERKYRWGGSLIAQRGPKGHTLVATEEKAEEYSPEKKLIASVEFLRHKYQLILAEILSLRGNRLICRRASGSGESLLELDLKTEKTRQVGSMPMGSRRKGEVKYLDETSFLQVRVKERAVSEGVVSEWVGGKLLWQVHLRGAGTPLGRLPNGEALVSCENSVEPRLVKLGSAGDPLLEVPVPGLVLAPCLRLVHVGFPKLSSIDLDTSSLPARLKVLQSGDVSRRRKTARVLGEFGATARPAIPTLIEALGDPDQEVREQSLTAIEKSMDAAALPLLVKATKHEKAEVRARAIYLLSVLREEVKGVLPTILAGLKDSDVGVRTAAAEVLGQIGPIDQRMVPALVETIADKEPRVRGAAVRTLGDFRSEAKPAIPALLAASKSLDIPFREAVVDALGEIGVADGAVMRLLIESLNDNEYLGLRLAGACALAKLGKRAKVAIPDLVTALRTKNNREQAMVNNIRRLAAVALGEIGPEASQAVPRLGELLEAEESTWDVRLDVVEALGKIGVNTPAVLKALEKAQKDQDHRVKESAVSALGKLRRKD